MNTWRKYPLARAATIRALETRLRDLADTESALGWTENPYSADCRSSIGKLRNEYRKLLASALREELADAQSAADSPTPIWHNHGTEADALDRTVQGPLDLATILERFFVAHGNSRQHEMPGVAGEELPF